MARTNTNDILYMEKRIKDYRSADNAIKKKT